MAVTEYRDIHNPMLHWVVVHNMSYRVTNETMADYPSVFKDIKDVLKTVEINNHATQPTTWLYPLLTTYAMYIEGDNPLQSTVLYEIDGKKLLALSCRGPRIDLLGFALGVYSLRATYHNGKSSLLGILKD